MPSLTFGQIAEMTGGRVHQGADVVASSVVIDSREIKDDSVFFAIRGDRLDGHQFVEAALERGRGVVVDRPVEAPAGRGVVVVEDTTIALQQLAKKIRQSRAFTLIGVTGSAGKTTTKEMIATLAATERPTFKSWGNFNNQIGCPLCLANTPDDASVVVSEMGMNHKGEIAFLSGLFTPDLGVYTTIQPVHLEFFGTIEGIAAAKRELLENLRPGGIVIANADDAHVMRISDDYDGPRVTYGIDQPAQYRGTAMRERGLRGTEFVIEAEGGSRPVNLPLPGRHNVENLLAAVATARTIGISWEGIIAGIADLKPAYHRGVLVDWKGASLYDDTYNSNPYALGRALELLDAADCEGRRIAVIGDMLELGGGELEFHRTAGTSIPRSVQIVAGVGPRSKALIDGAREAGFDESQLHHFDTAADAAVFLRSEIKPGDLVLLKGSRGIGLDRIITTLESED